MQSNAECLTYTVDATVALTGLAANTANLQAYTLQCLRGFEDFFFS